jgi:hypothetical protein
MLVLQAALTAGCAAEPLQSVTAALALSNLVISMFV